MDAGPASKVKSISSDILEAISFPIAIPFSVYSFGIAVGRKDILRKIVAVATREECFEKKMSLLTRGVSLEPISASERNVLVPIPAQMRRIKSVETLNQPAFSFGKIE